MDYKSNTEYNFSTMPHMKLVMEGDGILNDRDPEKTIHIRETITVTALANGMESGRPSVAFIIPLEDGQVVLAETSMRLFHSAAKAFGIQRFEVTIIQPGQDLAQTKK